jgi:hypothetical protein
MLSGLFVMVLRGVTIVLIYLAFALILGSEVCLYPEFYRLFRVYTLSLPQVNHRLARKLKESILGQSVPLP